MPKRIAALLPPFREAMDVPGAVVVAERATASSEEILTPSALVFLAELVRAFRARIRAFRGTDLDITTVRPKERRPNHAGGWSCAPPPAALAGPRIDLIGAADPTSITNALASHASAFVADLDDAMLPCWRDLLAGQALLKKVASRPRGRDHHAQAPMPPVLLRPRPLSEDEEHVFVDGEPVPAGLIDVGLYCFHNGAVTSDSGEGPWLSLTKLRGRADARLWADIAVWLEHRLALRGGSIRFGLRVDTASAVDELDAMLWTLRSRVLSVECGRFELMRDLITSASGPGPVTPARDFFTVDRAPLAAAAIRIADVCRRRRVHAIGPVLARVGSSRIAYAHVYADAARQARHGFHGTQVVDADLVPIARAAFHASDRAGSCAETRALSPSPPPSESAVRENIEIALRHLDAALGGRARVRLDASLEDCASARAARAQLWEWIQARVSLSIGGRLDRDAFQRLVRDESLRLRPSRIVRAQLEHICTAESAEVLVEREDQLRRELTVTPEP